MVPCTPGASQSAPELSARYIDELQRHYSHRDSEGKLVRKQVTVADFLLFIEQQVNGHAFKGFKDYIIRREDYRRAMHKSSFVSNATENQTMSQITQGASKS